MQPALDDLDLFGPSFQDGPPAVYEQLRRSGAVHYLPRHDTSLGGVDIPAGAVLVVSFAWANRDEDVYADAARFDPDRHVPEQHLAFGLGRHACIGNPLARMEGVVALQVLADHVEAMPVIGRGRLRYNASFMVRGLRELPVRVCRRPA